MRWTLLIAIIAALLGCEDRAAVARTETKLREVDLPRIVDLVQKAVSYTHLTLPTTIELW